MNETECPDCDVRLTPTVPPYFEMKLCPFHAAAKVLITQLGEALKRAVSRPGDPDTWMIPDTDGNAGVDECFYCGKDEDWQEGQPFEHDPTCAGLLAREALTAYQEVKP